jgi:RapZ C-terminal domain
VALVIVGGATPERVEAALRAFEAEGWRRAAHLDDLDGGAPDHVLGAPGGAAETLRAADDRGLRYVLVHHGPSDRQPAGTYERAHHRVESAQLAELARRVRSRDTLLVRCLAFGYRHGIPEGSAWVVDVRFLENPYWVPGLRHLNGLDEPVRRYVLDQPAAGALLDGLQRTLEAVLDEYRRRGRMALTLAFGCTGGQHRSVAVAAALAERLRESRPDLEVEFRARELEPAAP